MNIFNEFHQRFLFELLRDNVDFIVVGGYSVVFHGYIRTTGDMDLWIRPTNENNRYDDLIINKLSTGRLKDLADVEELKKIHNNK